MTELFVSTLKVLHLAILLFTLIGWLLPQNLLLVYLVWIPMMFIQWQFNQGTCILTNIENWLLGEKQQKQEQQGQFIKSLWQQICGQVPSDKVLRYVVNGTIWLCWLLACLRWYLA